MVILRRRRRQTESGGPLGRLRRLENRHCIPLVFQRVSYVPAKLSAIGAKVTPITSDVRSIHR
jgi:hypothetical protein